MQKIAFWQKGRDGDRLECTEDLGIRSFSDRMQEHRLGSLREDARKLGGHRYRRTGQRNSSAVRVTLV